MNFEVVDSYEATIKKVACSVGPRGGVDELGQDRGDYESDLRIISWETQLKFRNTHGFCTPAERRYVQKALWNRGRKFARHRSMIRAKAFLLEEPDVPGSTQFEDVCRRLEARSALDRIRRHLVPEDFEVLMRVGVANGDVRAAWCPEEDGPYTNFWYRVNRLRSRASGVLETKS